MKINEIVTEASYGDDPKSRMIADLGRKLMDMSASMKITKDTPDEAIEKSNKMSAFGDALTRWGTDFGPKNLNDVVKLARVTPAEAKEFLEIAQKAKPAKLKGDEVEPEEPDTDDDFDDEDDDAMAAKADRAARGR